MTDEIVCRKCGQDACSQREAETCPILGMGFLRDQSANGDVPFKRSSWLVNALGWLYRVRVNG